VCNACALHATDLCICFQTLAGRTLEAWLPINTTVHEMKSCVSAAWRVAPNYQQLAIGTEVINDFETVETILEKWPRPRGEALNVMVVTQQEPLPDDNCSQLSALIAKLQATDSAVRGSTIRTLARVVNVDSARELEYFVLEVQSLICGPSAAVTTKRACLEALARVSPKDDQLSIQVAFRLLGDRSDFVRLSAAESVAALANRGNKEVISMAQRLLKRGSPAVKVAAVMVLGDVANEESKTTLEMLGRYSDSKDENICIAASEAVSLILRNA